ncbi:hypothetical protein JW998_08935 [candidate division KSB1 bacterium]|nr:hypothetical protein [candidate division KSB1 bacterium]
MVYFEDLVVSVNELFYQQDDIEALRKEVITLIIFAFPIYIERRMNTSPVFSLYACNPPLHISPIGSTAEQIILMPLTVAPCRL